VLPATAACHASGGIDTIIGMPLELTSLPHV
jgi:hypothetical protein